MREVHADLVRAPGLELGFEQRQRRVGCGHTFDAPEDRAREPAVGIDADAPLAVARHVSSSATARPRAARRATCRAPARDSACRSRRRAAARAIRSSALRFLATSSTPDVSRSSRWTSSRKAASGRAWRNRSMTPNEMPLPPWTARPAGLSSAISASSSNRIGGSADPARMTSAPGLRAGAAARIGGTRRRSPAQQAGVRPDPALVHAHLAAAQDPVDVALGNALEDLDQVIVDALTRRRPRRLQASSQHPCLNHSYA